jgi:stage III sporulation protein SpoIIIAA
MCYMFVLDMHNMCLYMSSFCFYMCLICQNIIQIQIKLLSYFLKWENITRGGQVTTACHHKTCICGGRIIETASVKTITKAGILGQPPPLININRGGRFPLND